MKIGMTGDTNRLGRRSIQSPPTQRLYAKAARTTVTARVSARSRLVRGARTAAASNTGNGETTAMKATVCRRPLWRTSIRGEPVALR